MIRQFYCFALIATLGCNTADTENDLYKKLYDEAFFTPGIK